MSQENLNDRQRLIYNIMTKVCDVGDSWETSKAIEEWVNDNFHVGDFRVIGSLDDYDLEDVTLEWQ